MNEEDKEATTNSRMHGLNEFAQEALNAVLFNTRLLAQADPNAEEAMAIRDVWTVIRLFAQAAAVQHQRLLGIDVAQLEEQLIKDGGLPWRAIYKRSSDSEPQRSTRGEVTNDRAAPTATPQIRMEVHHGMSWVMIPLGPVHDATGEVASDE